MFLVPPQMQNQNQNPTNFNFMSFSNNNNNNNFPSMIPKDDNGGLMMMMESGSRNDLQFEEGNEEDEDGDNQHPSKKKRYHRHTSNQIQEMESLFKECPHPDDKQRLKLSQELGLKPRQVKFWFQNRRTQMKAQQDRSENMMLRVENDSLKNESFRLQTELRNVHCPNCGGPSTLGGIPFKQLQLENSRLKEELERVFCLASRYSNQPIEPIEPIPYPMATPRNFDTHLFADYAGPSVATMTTMLREPSSSIPNGLVLVEEEKGVAMNVALSSMNELETMCKTDEPLWIRGNGNGTESLDLKEYDTMFPSPSSNLKHLQSGCESRIEASRDSCIVTMNSVALVDAFVDSNKWMELFPSIVARAKTIQIISSGVSSSSGSLQLMYAEFQIVSPLVGSRESYFLRYCHENVDEGYWTVVDFSLDSFRDNVRNSFPLFRRKPSGCRIENMPNGYSKVTWVEHVEIEEKPVHQIFSRYVYSGLAFGANRWLAVLNRQCERVANVMTRNTMDHGVISSQEGRKNVMRLAQRMVRLFCVNVSSSCGQTWTSISDSVDDTVRIATRRITEPGQPNGVVLCAVSTTWLPYSHNQVFDLLRDEQRRTQLEILSNGSSLHNVARIVNGSQPENCISLLRINVASNSSHNVELMLQESCTDESGSLVVYTTVDVDLIQHAMNGDDPSNIPLLPLGFIIVPVEPNHNNHNNRNGNVEENSVQSPDINQDQTIPIQSPRNSGHSSYSGHSGCLLTIGLQVHVTTVLNARINLSTVTALNNHLGTTVRQIGAALSSGNVVISHDNDIATTLSAPWVPLSQ